MLANKHHKTIHEHCIKRQHEALSKDILEIFKSEACNCCDRWMVSPRAALFNATNLSKTTETFTDTDDKIDHAKVLKDARFSESLDILFLNRGEVEIALSEYISLTISLVNHGQQHQQHSVASEMYDQPEIELENRILACLKTAYCQCVSQYVTYLMQMPTISKNEKTEMDTNQEAGDTVVSHTHHPDNLLRECCNRIKYKLRSLYQMGIN